MLKELTYAKIILHLLIMFEYTMLNKLENSQIKTPNQPKKTDAKTLPNWW